MARTITVNTKQKKLSTAERREAEKRAEEQARYGVTLGDISIGRKPGRFYLCFIRAILIFMACFGMLGALVSSFNLSFSLPLVAGSLFALSFLTAFLYYNKLTFYVGYFLIFAGFIFFSQALYWYINSGYQAFMNEVFNAYSDYFRLLSTREATEFIENRYITVSVAMIFMGWFFCILLNISISGYMNMPVTFLLTFLPLQIAFYIDIVPPLPYLCLLLATYISVTLLGRSGHFTLPYRQERLHFFQRKRKKKSHIHVYQATSGGMLQVSAYSIGFSAIFLLLTAGIFANDLNSRYISNTVKNSTDRIIKAVVQGGIYSLFNRYNATGGLARGQLGGIGNVNPDYQTDLIVRFVPNNSDGVYLRSYIGAYYEGSSFQAFIPGDGETPGTTAEELLEAENYLPRLALPEDPDFDDMYNNDNYTSKMWVANLDADPGSDYLPYFSVQSSTKRSGIASGFSDEFSRRVEKGLPEEGRLPLGTSDFGDEEDYDECYEVLYLPYESLVSYNPNPDPELEEYQDFVYEHYLQVPEELEEVLDDFCEEADLDPALTRSTKRMVAPSDAAELDEYKRLQQIRLGAAASLKRYFATNFDYTMSPGTTPRGTDVVEYFLQNQKRGFCAHFASSSTLILRHLGIPTRYVEGYAMTVSEIMDGTPLSNSTEGWQSETPEHPGSGIVEVEVTDGSAHAWIEIWLDGYGWIPYEMTPPSSEEPMVNLDLFSLFSGIFNTRPRNVGNTTTTTTTTTTNNGSLLSGLGSLSFLLRPLAILSAALVLFLVSFSIFRALREEWRLLMALHSGDYASSLLIRYRRFVRKMRSRGRLMQDNPTVRDCVNALLLSGPDDKPLPKEESDLLGSCVSRAAFSKEGISPAQYKECKTLIRKLGQRLKRAKKPKTKKKQKSI
ncbi:MAG: transglutaminase-like domain-containing protein [Lachnospiraceae bacterium]|nr:transglutaminase-like domain-containing protein [Lachnospiraceae bacterium]